MWKIGNQAHSLPINFTLRLLQGTLTIQNAPQESPEERKKIAKPGGGVPVTV